jgi:hypothetical protein
MKYQVSAPGGQSTRSPLTTRRIEAIDFARGVAVSLMILSHGTVGLVALSDFPAWGLVPIHLITKFSSSLFILVFGIALAVVHLPKVGTEKWPRMRAKLLVRGLVIFFWYKVLVIVEMMQLYTPEDIKATLLYRAFPVYVEILGFYAIALMWVPFVLPAWKRAPIGLKACVPIVLAWLGHQLYGNFHFWGSESLQAILVEHEKHYTWGQLARAPLIFVGLILGEFVSSHYWDRKNRLILSAAVALVAVGCFVWFRLLAVPDAHAALVSVARNEGKHPPELRFMLFSLGGAFFVIAVILATGETLARILRPITIIGQDALQAFIFHIFVLFVFFRYLMDYWRNVDYGFALALAVLLIALTAVWIRTLDWVQKKTAPS